MRYQGIGVGAILLLAAGSWYALLAQQPGARPPGNEAALVSHGEYLVSAVAHCSHCHTPQDPKGQPVRDRLLQGATLPVVPKQKTDNWAAEAPDITKSGLAGMWSEQEMVKFLMTGTNPEGMKPTPPMPVFRLHEQDARAVTAYLRSLPGKKDGIKRKGDTKAE
jgi:mono/diheme cytochrome c family protein